MTNYVIFDRDGTLIEHIHYLKDPNLVKLKPGVAAGLQLLHMSKYRFGIITNQSIINRMIATEQEVIDVNRRVSDICSDFKINFDFIYVCPHTPLEQCRCRKPEIKLGLEAISNFQIDTTSSFYIGDQHTDVEFAKRLKFNPILLNQKKLLKINESYLEFPDLFEAALYITKTNFLEIAQKRME